MKKIPQIDLIYEFLKENSGKKFTARDIAIGITQKHKSRYDTKRKKHKTEQDFLKQIIAEIGRNNPLLEKRQNIQMQVEPRPRLYWYEEVLEVSNIDNQAPRQALQLKSDDNKSDDLYDEHDLYPKLIEYLSSDELGLGCLRIDEKRSKKTRGENGNYWLHPDIVAMQAIDRKWHNDIKMCIKHSAGQKVRLWSFEVKKTIKKSNVRECFFQALSNSSWANEGYLVATSIDSQNTVNELRILSDLHGIGVILLDVENPAELSKIFIPAKRKENLDWQSMNRIAEDNPDFVKFVRQVSNYCQTGDFIKEVWNK